LIQDQDSSTVEKAPLLGDLPLIGAFFRHLSTTHQKTELVFLMTPHIKPAVLTSGDIPAPFVIPPKPAPDPVPTPLRLIPTGSNH
jgi:pilus assembly protein CpaC